jgi:acyl-CoA hydrolase
MPPLAKERRLQGDCLHGFRGVAMLIGEERTCAQGGYDAVPTGPARTPHPASGARPRPKQQGAAPLSTLHLRDAARCAEAIVDCVGRDVRIAVPIGIGKPMLLLNALVRLAEADRRVRLTIFTGLTLARPRLRSLPERRLVEPLLARLFASYPEPLYAVALREGRLAANISVNEFFLQAGEWLNNGPVQRNYISLNYSHVARHLERAGTNVFAQLVAPNPRADDGHVSLSSNTDVTLDMLPYIARRRSAGEPLVVAGEVNGNLPYMPGQAEIAKEQFDILLRPEAPPYALFAPPKQPVSLVDYAMALYAATLIKDGGTLQIGIGSFADALAHALILRHTRNGDFRALLQRLAAPLAAGADLEPFSVGLYGCTEMLVDAFLALKDAGILRRRVTSPDGHKALLHAGFFLGSQAFYSRLAGMPAEELREICMTGISYTNTLAGEEARKRSERTDARFVNTAMTATLLGAVSSDTLEDGRVVSGVGGQHDLVTMAHELAGARSIIAVRSTRRRGRRAFSNIAWECSNATLPRALRDVVVTEYGIADLKGKSDRDTVAAMLSVADAAFQPRLQGQAGAAGKLEARFALPPHARANRPERIAAALSPGRNDGLLPTFPLGTELSEVERSLSGPLLALKSAGWGGLLRMFAAGLGAATASGEFPALERLGLAAPATLGEHAWRVLVRGALRHHTAPAGSRG